MSVNDWTPDTQLAQQQIDSQWLKKCIAMSQANALETMAEQIDAADLREKAAYMRLPPEQWQAATTHFNNDELIALIRFFTRAEMLLSGWEAGNSSPVIALNKALRQRGEKLSKETLLWIRANSDNRYIPNGAL
ncbi:hypothetical protein IMCC21906_02449 [Spongiibacter sp. IMCC21906]|uniref:hypothetical protein n=1 Tax=Spongiibacter sp. IMCC21906 TaxID=1620392 RepID=UPI00062E0713|nr:hypothetical protein [Spongiibacter sp. IMCC21906]AKH70104.1 hypothetical protein IMCC21906_02449 [Spongiibacter sp. IMCC21906]